MKKLTAILLAALTAMVLTACGKTDDAPAETKAENSRPARAETTKAEAEESSEQEYGITLDEVYYPCGNPNWGEMKFLSDGSFRYKDGNGAGYEFTWAVDDDTVYVINDDGEEYEVSIYENGDIFVLDDLPVAISGFEPSVTYSALVKCGSDHDWLDILELDYGTAKYINLEDGEEADSGEAVALTFDNYLVVTPNVYNSASDAVVLETYDDGYTFENEDYTYYPYDPSEGGSGVFTPFEAAVEMGVAVNSNYYSDLNDEIFFYISDDGLLNFYDVPSDTFVPLRFEIDDRTFYLYAEDGAYIGELEFNGSTFYEEASDTEYAL
jgi:hypothetical protein